MRNYDERQQHSVILSELPFRVSIKFEELVGQRPEILVNPSSDQEMIRGTNQQRILK